ncbi:MAG: cob(I)yrinic acid a,c-diamide adenosyltransferase [Chloroflexi bacterium]|nr:cob(I)yrinic acid a,c-diamide adenosyltransferase [Chloroflexota bacterium]MDE2651307.1 cob(I)yrinic acid a,c-diamide adenosyltransferase [Chloroflexota bacterium]
MKIYTKTGDGGSTALFAGGRVPKHHLRVEAYGTIDELNSLLGVVRAAQASQQTDAWLELVQNQLFHLGADLATPLAAKSDWVTRISPGEIRWLEASIDQMAEQLPPLRNFVLPGGVPAAAQLQVARAVCRRAERILSALSQSEDIGTDTLAYVNRLSDWLFTVARYENWQAGENETKWSLRES